MLDVMLAIIPVTKSHWIFEKMVKHVILFFTVWRDRHIKIQYTDKMFECGAYSVRENSSGCKLFKVTNQGGNWGSGCDTDSNWKGFYKRDCKTKTVVEKA